MRTIQSLRQRIFPEPAEMVLIAGLGNPGLTYQNNRHNIGFMVVDEIARRLGTSFTRVEQRALVAKADYLGRRILLAKPRTYMNLSGQAIGGLARFYKIPPAQVLVIFDDADLPYETIRLRHEGGSSGQKGMKSIIEHLGTQEFPRLRVGIGRPPGRMSTPDYVLQDFSKDQMLTLAFVQEKAAEAALAFAAEGIVPAMNKYNRAE